MGKGTNTTTNSTTTAPSAQAATAYGNVLNQAQTVAATPYAAYTGEGVAPFNAEQNAGVAGINNYANAAQPAINYATGQAMSSSSPLTAAQIQQYESPYTQQVVNATQAQFNNQNAQQQQGVVGNAIAQGALGGNRSAIAQAETANQQQLAQAPVIAGLQNQGYNQAVQTAEQQQQTGLAGANSIGSLGVAGQNAGISGAGAQLSAGTAQQQTQQALDTYLQQQYAQAQAYPFQTAQWLAGIDTGVGSQLGGTSSGQTTTPPPNLLGQIAGGVTSGAGLLGATGAYGSAGWLMPALAGLARGGIAQIEEVIKRAEGGAVTAPQGVAGFASGGSPTSGVATSPWANAPSWVPAYAVSHGSGAPHASAPAPYQVPQNPLTQQASSLGSLAKSIKDSVNGDTPQPYGSNVLGATGPSSVGGAPLQGVANPYYGGGNAMAGDAYGGNASAPLPGLNASDYGPMNRGGVASFATGGVAGFAAGGSPDNDDSNVINPDEPYRLAGPAAMDDWRNNSGPNKATAADSTPPKTEGIAPSHSMSFSKTDKPDTSGVPDEVALGYSPSDKSNGIAPPEVRSSNEPKPTDWGSDNKLWPSLISAGAGMLASRSPFLGNAIGEGIQAGSNSYNLQNKEEREAKQHADQLELERQRLNKPYEQMTMAQKAENDRANITQRNSQFNQPVIAGPDGKPITNTPYVAAHEALEKDKWSPIGTVVEGDHSYPAIMNQSSGEVRNAVTGKAPSDGAKFEVKGQKAEISDEDAHQIAQYTVDTGDNSRLTGLGYSGSNKVKVQSAINQYMREKNLSNDEMARRRQEYAAQGTAATAGARTRATREENLAIILNTTEAAIPAALEASKEVARTGFVPLNKIIQNGRLMTSDPSQVKFGIANLQLAEGWARAMNPTGVMRESDREKALQYLDTALGAGTYEQAVNQIHTQIIREREATHKGSTTLPKNGEAPVPGQQTAAPATAAPAGAINQKQDVKGNWWYVDKDGKVLGPAAH